MNHDGTICIKIRMHSDKTRSPAKVLSIDPVLPQAPVQQLDLQPEVAAEEQAVDQAV